MQQMAGQRVQDDPASRPLPSYEMPWVDTVDPDRTLKRQAIRVGPSANSTEEICAEDVLEVIKVARKAPTAESTQEIAAEDIEDVVGVAALRAGPRSYPTPLITVFPEPSIAPPARPAVQPRADATRRDPERGSVAPVALDSDSSRSRADSTFMLDDTPYGMKMPRMGYAIAGGLGAMVGIFVLVFALGSAGAKPVVQMGAVAAKAPVAAAGAGVAAAAAAAPVVKAASAGPSSGVPTIDVSSLPRAAVGTVSLAKSVTGHRLFVDGTVATAASTVVSCGKHLVKVGSKGRKQEVDVPCGTDVVVGY